MTKPRYSLYYFDARGRAEAIRLLLAHVGADWEDKAFSGAEWPAMKAQMALGQAPMLVEHRETGDVKIPQTMAIIRHLARVHGADGRTEEERLAADVVAECVLDLSNAFGQLRYSAAWQDPAAKEKYVHETVPPHLGRLDKLIQDRTWAAGTTPTYADLLVFEVLDIHVAHWPKLLGDRPRLTAWAERVRGLPSLAAYLPKRRPAS